MNISNKKPRNHVVLAMAKRVGGSGSHIKSDKSIRRKNKIDLKKMLYDKTPSKESYLLV